MSNHYCGNNRITHSNEFRSDVRNQELDLGELGGDFTDNRVEVSRAWH